MADTAALVITSLASGGFALAGVGLSNWMAARREGRAFRSGAALELAGLESLIWRGEWVDLESELQRQRARLAVSGVPDDLIDALSVISLACWRNHRRGLELFGEEEGGGIRTELIEARQLVHSALGAYLLGNKRGSAREALRTQAVSTAERVANDRQIVDWVG